MNTNNNNMNNNQRKKNNNNNNNNNNNKNKNKNNNNNKNKNNNNKQQTTNNKQQQQKQTTNNTTTKNIWNSHASLIFFGSLFFSTKIQTPNPSDSNYACRGQLQSNAFAQASRTSSDNGHLTMPQHPLPREMVVGNWSWKCETLNGKCSFLMVKNSNMLQIWCFLNHSNSWEKWWEGQDNFTVSLRPSWWLNLQQSVKP